MNVDNVLERVESFSDLQIACLLCLVAGEHFIIESNVEPLDELAEELGLIASDVFDFSYVIVQCSKEMQLEDFGDAILAVPSYAGAGMPTGSDLRAKLGSVQFGRKQSSHAQDAGLDTRKVANVVIAKDFNLAPEAIQVQALELIRRRRIYGRSTIHPAPEIFLFIPVVSGLEIPVNKHLNDHIMMHHRWSSDEELGNLSAQTGDGSPGRLRAKSGRWSEYPSSADKHTNNSSIATIKELQQRCHDIRISPEVRRYAASISVSLRLQRGYFKGVSPRSALHLIQLSRALAVIHHLSYLTPSLVHLAAQKVYTHRIELPSPERERSFQYGSDLQSIKELLAGLTPEMVTDEALSSLEQPP